MSRPAAPINRAVPNATPPLVAPNRPIPYTHGDPLYGGFPPASTRSPKLAA